MALIIRTLMQKLNILDLIPQRPPMVMVDEIIEVSENKIMSRFTILPGNVLCESSFFSESGLIENIAQTAAAQLGCSLLDNQNSTPPIGFIGALKNLSIHSLPKENSTIETEVIILHRIMDASVIEGKVFQDAILIAECEMKIFLKPTN